MQNILIEELRREIQSLKNENIDLKKQQIEISKAKELYLGILEEFPALIWRANTEKLCDYFNTTWLQFTGRTMEQEYGYGWAEGVHPDDLDRCVEIYNLNFDQRKSFSMEYRLKNANQEYHWILDIGRPYYDLDGTFLGYIGSCYDITEQKNTQEKLETIQSEMKVIVQAVEQTNEMVRITDKDAIITYVNDAVITETGYAKEELIGQKSSIFKSGKQDESFYKNLWDTVLSGNIYKNVIINKRKDGTLYHEEQTITPVFDEQNNLSFVSTGHDISERIEVEKKLHTLATRDTLTGVYNRYSLNKEIDINIKKYERYEDIFGLLMLDIDHFKNVNDTYGHDVGDLVLKELCSVIENLIRETDVFGRWGGEEFLLILPKTNKDEAISIATRIKNIIEEHKFEYIPQVTVSIGVSIYTQSIKKEIFLKDVDDALYKAKSTGRNRVEYK
jgi:diguanylate cyclase (GGDEF)-like protein/PAS domain S-box-containing protein